ILIRPREAIPLGRPYRTRPNRPRRVMIVRKRVGPLPAHRLAWRRVSPRSLDHRPSSSSSPTDSSPVHYSGLDAPGQAHSGTSTRVVSPRLGYPSSSSGDSSERPLHSSSHSVGPSRKRCRSPTDYVPSSTLVMGSLAPTRADLLPRQSEDGGELDIVDRDDVRDHIKVDPRDDREEFEASAGDIILLGIDPRSVEDMPIDLNDAIRDFYHHMSEVCVDKIVGIETTQRQLEAD
nr:hypothetical protein [Tanacetum cinerariifolium]